MNNDVLYQQAVELLKKLISTPSFSKEEAATAEIIQHFFEQRNIPVNRIGYNLFAKNLDYDPAKPTLLLNSHHDTVKPNKGYTVDPFSPAEKEGRLYGLGSNDAGGCLVSLMSVFLHFYERRHSGYNIVFAASAEEEISGSGGIEMVLPHLGRIDVGIVGEPTRMEMAIAERGLLVVDCLATGKAGHAARNEGENALYKAIDDCAWIRNYRFSKKSELLGETRMSVTVMDTDNRQHNVVPATCSYVIDIRVNELYTFEEILDLLKQNLKSVPVPRSLRMKPSSIPMGHPLVKAGLDMGLGYYGSPTTSDKALMPFPALKMGPGDSARSHMADEFIYLDEIRKGIDTYIGLIEKLITV